jgi:hypothetical protein
LKKLNEHRRKLAIRANPFFRRRKRDEEQLDPQDDDPRPHSPKVFSSSVELV